MTKTKTVVFCKYNNKRKFTKYQYWQRLMTEQGLHTVNFPRTANLTSFIVLEHLCVFVVVARQSYSYASKKINDYPEC